MDETTDTIKLRLGLYTGKHDQSVFPKSLITALRAALEAELSAEEITAAVLLMIGVKKIATIDSQSIVGRTLETLRVMKGLQEVERVEAPWRGKKKN